MSPLPKTVLLVEDNEDNRIVYSTILRHFGYRVMEALNGEEGIATARAEKPDLILMDISIPIIDGWEATQVLKHDPETRKIPIIALTAHALASDRERAMEVGCDGYLAKPCEPRAVVAEVQRFLGRPAGVAPIGGPGNAATDPDGTSGPSGPAGTNGTSVSSVPTSGAATARSAGAGAQAVLGQSVTG
jgi:CheY-like chemotaxis protein